MTRRSPSSLAFLAQSYASAGRRAEAVVLLDEVLSIARTTYVSPVSLYGVYFNLGDPDSAFAWVDKALDERSNGAACIAVDRYFDEVRDDPRYRQIVKRVGLPDGR